MSAAAEEINNESSPRSTLIENHSLTTKKQVMATETKTTETESAPQPPQLDKTVSEDSSNKDTSHAGPKHERDHEDHPYHLTPNIGGNPYYLGYPPESPSPAGHHVVYESIGAFLPAGDGAFGTFPNAHFSPPRAPIGIVNPSASPLFPRMEARGVSPSLPYISPGQPPMSYYTQQAANASDDDQNWNEGNGHASPAMPYGIPIPRAVSGGRAYSFESDMLPPPAEHDPAYSPYDSQSSQGGAFVPPAWYGAGAPELYSGQGVTLQPRPSGHGVPMEYGGPSMGRPLPPYGHPFFPASSPGPPIQTTASNKGPDGANLFIFHIPNHFTNLDMYQLFCPYGNLLSVRIMVEKDTGRSRGFGFVSYDSPESAALAIKELNGFAVGNKRLKVQHKQIRRDSDRDGFGDSNYPRSPYEGHLPPPGPSSSHFWHESKVHAEGEKHDETTEMTSTSTGGEPSTSPLNSLNALQSSLPEVSDQKD